MKIAILYICTGKYDIFWSDFYYSAEKYFCSTEEKHYFVFTDSASIVSSENISIIHQDNLGWPFNTLYRYRMFLRLKEQLCKFDKVVFFNANYLFIRNIDVTEFFGEDKEIVAGVHPGFFNKAITEYTLETRYKSLAYVPQRYIYVQGCINGGNARVMLDIFQHLWNNIESDLDNGIVAIWHDESHWNAYLNNNYEALKDKLNILSPSYLYPDGCDLPFEKKIILRDKTRHGGHDILRGVAQNNSCNGIKKVLKKFICR
jgi:hypothetical protein